MKYCKKCGRMFNDSAHICKECKRETLVIGKPDKTFPVFAVRAAGFEKERICSALDNEKIAYSTRIAKKQFSTDALTGTSNAYYDILVPYGLYTKTIDLLIGINAITPNEKEIEKIDRDIPEDEFDGEDYFSTKNKVIRIVSVILLLAVVTGVVFGVDTIMGIVKQYLF